FSATVDRQNRLWLRQMDSASTRQLPGTDNADYPFWSPDNRSIAFFADGKLKRIDIDSGAVQLLGTAPLGKGGAWGPHGQILFAQNNSGPIFQISAAGGEAQPVTRTDETGASHRHPQFLPDGRHFLYSTGRSMFAATLDGREKHRIVDAL